MIRVSPLMGISVGLVSLTISFILIGNSVVNLVPDEREQTFRYRQTLAETLAVQYSSLAVQEDFQTIDAAMNLLVNRNNDILSTALRLSDGTILVIVGPHDEHWISSPGQSSTLDNIQVPILTEDTIWGTLEVSFQPDHNSGLWEMLTHPWVRFIAFVALAGFLGYWVFMKRSLKHLDPSSVIPKRVKAAFDILDEGVILTDSRDHIVLANSALSNKVNKSVSSLLGMNASTLPWSSPDPDTELTSLPWTTARETKTAQIGVPLLLQGPRDEQMKILVNSTPILDDKGQMRGVLSSFDDVTELEQANNLLLNTVKELTETKEQVVRQNEELEKLATRDPLTGCLNRRAFFEQLEQAYLSAREHGTPLSCMMTDIDHFKSFNDRYGHALGDQVIQVVVRTISESLRPTDIMGRYGGEEFCVVLPNADGAQATEIAERICRRIETESGSKIRTTSGIRITSSFGVSTMDMMICDPGRTCRSGR